MHLSGERTFGGAAEEERQRIASLSQQGTKTRGLVTHGPRYAKLAPFELIDFGLQTLGFQFSLPVEL
jgi:hypothetical protein